MPECKIVYQCPCCSEVVEADLHATARMNAFVKKNANGDIDTIDVVRIEAAYMDNAKVVDFTGDRIEPKEYLKLKKSIKAKTTQTKKQKKVTQKQKDPEAEDAENNARLENEANKSD